MSDKPMGDFTPGAGLNPEQVKTVLSFVTCRGKTNDETLERMGAFFGMTPEEVNKS